MFRANDSVRHNFLLIALQVLQRLLSFLPNCKLYTPQHADSAIFGHSSLVIAVFGLVSAAFGLVSAVFGLVIAVFGLVRAVFGLVSAVFGLVSAVFGLVSAVFGLVSAVFGLVSAVFGLVSAVFGLVSAVFGLVSAVFGHDCCQCDEAELHLRGKKHATKPELRLNNDCAPQIGRREWRDRRND